MLYAVFHLGKNLNLESCETISLFFRFWMEFASIWDNFRDPRTIDSDSRAKDPRNLLVGAKIG